VSRRYSADQSSCEEAIRRLLAFAKKEKKGGSIHRPDDAMKGSKSDRARNIIQN
jgi:hypothetical protein